MCCGVPVCTPYIFLLTVSGKQIRFTVRVKYSATRQNALLNVYCYFYISAECFEHIVHLLLCSAGSDDVDHAMFFYPALAAAVSDCPNGS